MHWFDMVHIIYTSGPAGNSYLKVIYCVTGEMLWCLIIMAAESACMRCCGDCFNLSYMYTLCVYVCVYVCVRVMQGGGELGKYKCLICQKEFSSESGVKYHISKTHSQVGQSHLKTSEIFFFFFHWMLLQDHHWNQPIRFLQCHNLATWGKKDWKWGGSYLFKHMFNILKGSFTQIMFS